MGLSGGVRRSRLPSRHFFESMILLYPLAGYFGALQCNIQPTMSMRLQFWDFCCVPKYRDRKLRLGQVIAFQHLLISAFLLATLVSSVFVFLSDVKSQQNLRQDLWVFFGGSFYCLKSNIGDAFLGRQANGLQNTTCRKGPNTYLLLVTKWHWDSSQYPAWPVHPVVCM